MFPQVFSQLPKMLAHELPEQKVVSLYLTTFFSS